MNNLQFVYVDTVQEANQAVQRFDALWDEWCELCAYVFGCLSWLFAYKKQVLNNTQQATVKENPFLLR